MNKKAIEHIRDGCAVEAMSLEGRVQIIALVLPDYLCSREVLYLSYYLKGREITSVHRDFLEEARVSNMSISSRYPVMDSIELGYYNRIIRDMGLPKLDAYLGSEIVEAIKRRRMYVGA